jgi:hypothetical protein
MPYKDPEKRREAQRAANKRWRERHPDRARDSNKRTKAKQDRAKVREQQIAWLAHNPDKARLYAERRNAKARLKRAMNPEAARAYHRAYYAANKQRVLALITEGARRRKVRDPAAYARMRRGVELKATYGITLADYDRMLAEQGGACRICGSTDPQAPVGKKNGVSYFNVDHCHETGAVRGLLCFQCNVGLGKFKDDPDLLLRAAQYLCDAGSSSLALRLVGVK